MSTLLFISNITDKITSFCSSSLHASQKLGMEYIHASNWSGSSAEERAVYEKENNIMICNVPINRSPFSLSNIAAYRQLCQIIRENRVDYIHCNTPVGGILGRLAGKRCRVKKVLYQAHGFHFYKGAPKRNWILYYPAERLLARFTDAIIVINREDHETAKKFRLRNNGKIYYVPGVGIDLEEFNGSEEHRNSKRRELGFSDDDLVIISVGELNRNKNTSVIISALGILKDPHIHYIICGVGDEKKKLQSLARESGLEDNIHFLGYRSDVMELYAASDIFVMPSFREGLSRSVMEAMASGLPCIVSRIRGNVDLVQEGKGGFLCAPDSPEEFADAIRKCDTDTRSRFRAYNLSAVKKYNISGVEDEMERIYTKEFGLEQT